MWRVELEKREEGTGLEQWLWERERIKKGGHEGEGDGNRSENDSHEAQWISGRE